VVPSLTERVDSLLTGVSIALDDDQAIQFSDAVTDTMPLQDSVGNLTREHVIVPRAIQAS
jgi:hypothetical protein